VQHHRSIKHTALSIIYIISAGLIGCGPKIPGRSPQTDVPDLVPMKTVIERVNQNNRDMDFLIKASGDTYAQYIDENGKKKPFPFFPLSHTLIYRKPRNLYIKLDKLLETVMEAGSNDKECWVWSKKDDRKYWWGLHEYMDKVDKVNIPIRPDRLLDVLGLWELPDNTTGPDGPVRWVGKDRYELIFMERNATGQLYITKTVCIDRREPFLIREMALFNPDGLPYMTAELSKYKTIEGSDVLAPHRIRIESLSDKYIFRLEIKKIRRFDSQLAEKKYISRSPRQRGENLGQVQRIDRPPKPLPLTPDSATTRPKNTGNN